MAHTRDTHFFQLFMSKCHKSFAGYLVLYITSKSITSVIQGCMVTNQGTFRSIAGLQVQVPNLI
jgi:hypothetical protein